MENTIHIQGQSFKDLVVMTFDKKSSIVTFLSYNDVKVGDRIRVGFKIDNPVDIVITEITDKHKHIGKYIEEENRRDHYTAKFKYAN